MSNATPTTEEAVVRRLQSLERTGLAPVLDEVLAAHPGVDAYALFSDSRLGHVADARAHFAYELYDRLGSYPAVGAVLNRDHTTVMWLRRRWAAVVGDVGPAKPARPSPLEPRAQVPYRHPSTVYTGGAR